MNDEILSQVGRIELSLKLILKGEPFYNLLEKLMERDKVSVKNSEQVFKFEDRSKWFSIEKVNNMRNIEQEILNCKKCPLHKSRLNAVPGVGNYNAKLMIVGEAPGGDEDKQGRPFVGKAGQLLTKLLEGIGIKRDEVYITNVLKCRPPNNRDPEESEVLACKGYLEKQIDIISPKVVLILGRISLKVLTGEDKITKVRGIPIDMGEIVYFPTFHPAAVLRDEKNKLPLIKEDFIKLKELLEKV